MQQFLYKQVTATISKKMSSWYDNCLVTKCPVSGDADGVWWIVGVGVIGSERDGGHARGLCVLHREV